MRQDLQKHTLNLRRGDWDHLDSVYRPQGLDTSTVIRTIIAAHVDKLRAAEPEVRVNLNEVDL